MNIRNLLLAALIPAALATGASAQKLNTDNAIFDPSFRSLKVQNADNFFAPPIITLGDPNDRLVVTFDGIGDDSEYLRYRILHCNADWQPSQLVESEFLDAFNDFSIDNFDFSVATFVHYVNYCITLDAESLPLLASGNYLLQVYPENEPDEVLLQLRFAVEEPAVEVDGFADSHTDRGSNDTLQQLRLAVEAARAGVTDPFNNVIVTIEQNYSPNTQTFIRNPQRVEGSRIIYEHLPALIFNAGNEYRRFETVNLLSPGMGVDSIRTIGSTYHAFLTPDSPKRDREYSYDRTQNGRYLVRDYNSSQPDLAADYVTTHFTLLSPEFTDAVVYIDGEFNAGQLNDLNRMTFDRELHAYTAAIPLKQGSYNYRYVVVQNGNPDPYFIDGNKYETRNEYTVKVFVRNPGQKADRLAGHATINAFH